MALNLEQTIFISLSLLQSTINILNPERQYENMLHYIETDFYNLKCWGVVILDKK